MRSGYSLIEIVIYLAILAMLAVVAVQTLLSVHFALSRIRATRALNATAAVAIERMIRIVRDAESVSAPAAGSCGTSLGLTYLDVSVHSFAVVGGVLRYTPPSSGALDLTPADVAVSSVEFCALGSGGESEAVKMKLGLSAASGRTTKMQTFYSTAVLRNSYAP